MSTRRGRLTTGGPTMRPLERTLTSATLAAALLALSTATAHADRWWGRDAARDVTQLTFTTEPPPCGTWDVTTQPQDTSTDLVGLTVDHGRDDVVLRAHYRGLTGFADRHVTFTLATDDRDFEVDLSHQRRRGVVAELWSAPTQPEPGGACDTYSTIQMGGGCEITKQVLPARDVVVVSVPRDCIGDPRWVRAGVRDQRAVGTRVRTDVWGRPDIGTIFDDEPLTPRVRRSR
ncbi:hypothetical protein [uncultured Nocardioides sp.]|uniref:hypothetical protein n=1 Tax=uncultured Nocardioides sp. TaxID=198441 RepID=UPI002623EDD3|nr:hypothetical protein [uncultured Nocardioides sp.]